MMGVNREASVVNLDFYSRLTSHNSRKTNSGQKVQVSDTTEAENTAAIGFQTKNR